MLNLLKPSTPVKLRALFFIFLGLSLILPGCKKEVPPVEEPPVLDGGVYILSEGNYQWGNGRADYLRFADNVYSEDVFNTINQRPLGDVVQSMKVFNGRGYIVVNNSGKIEVVDMAGFTSVGTITGLSSPRYMLPVSSTKAYVSDLYSNSVTIVDLSSLQVTGNIPVKGSTEEMLMVGETVYVTNTRTSFLYRINATTNTLTDSIAIGFAANSIVEDQGGKLWVMCAGDQPQSLNAGLYCIDPTTQQVVHHFDLGVYLQIWDKLRINGSKNKLYYLNSGVWCMDIAATTLPSSALIAQDGRLFHGIGIDPSLGNIYVSDAVDYVQHGKVFRYTPDGTLIDSLLAGIIPSEFIFY